MTYQWSYALCHFSASELINLLYAIRKILLGIEDAGLSNKMSKQMKLTGPTLLVDMSTIRSIVSSMHAGMQKI